MTHYVSWGVWEKSEKSVPELSRGPNPSSGGGRFQNLKLEWVPYFSSDFLSTSSKAVDVVDRRRSSSIIVVVIAANLSDFLSVVRLVARRSARQNRAETAGLRTPPHPDRGVYRYDLPLRDATEFGRGRIGRSWNSIQLVAAAAGRIDQSAAAAAAKVEAAASSRPQSRNMRPRDRRSELPFVVSSFGLIVVRPDRRSE